MAKTKIRILKGTILNVDAEAVVNPANSNLLRGDGCNSAIFYSAGIEELTKACAAIGNCKVGKGVITDGFHLSIGHIIHVVGPFWHGGYDDEAKKLASCYISALKICDENNIKKVAFPAISTGHGHYPLEEATQIAIASVRSYLSNHDSCIENVAFTCYSDEVLLEYKQENEKEIIDITPYLTRGNIELKKEMTRDEQSIVKKKLFKKEITDEQKMLAALSVLKRYCKKHDNLIFVSSKYKLSDIDKSFCDKKDGRSGPFVNEETISNIQLDGKKISFIISPYSYKGDEIEAIKNQAIQTKAALETKEEDEEKSQINIESLLLDEYDESIPGFNDTISSDEENTIQNQDVVENVHGPKTLEETIESGITVIGKGIIKEECDNSVTDDSFDDNNINAIDNIDNISDTIDDANDTDDIVSINSDEIYNQDEPKDILDNHQNENIVDEYIIRKNISEDINEDKIDNEHVINSAKSINALKPKNNNSFNFNDNNNKSNDKYKKYKVKNHNKPQI